MDSKIAKVASALLKNNMQFFYAATKEEIPEIVKGILTKGAKIAVGGSKTLEECGVLELIKGDDYAFCDRYKSGLTPEQITQVFTDSLSADFFVMSSNAITENGELYNVDGRSNRVAGLLFGPKEVIIVAGKNKIVKDLDEAVLRVKTIAAPLNAKRLNCNTYCAKFSKCVSLSDKGAQMPSGCNSSDRICCNYVVTAQQRQKDRIKVIICEENLGF